jgi:hypothetical protein
MGKAGRKNTTSAQLVEISDDMLDEISDNMRADNIIELIVELRDETATFSPETVAARMGDAGVDWLGTMRVWLDQFAGVLERKAKPDPAPATPTPMVH